MKIFRLVAKGIVFSGFILFFMANNSHASNFDKDNWSDDFVSLYYESSNENMQIFNEKERYLEDQIKEYKRRLETAKEQKDAVVDSEKVMHEYVGYKKDELNDSLSAKDIDIIKIGLAQKDAIIDEQNQILEQMEKVLKQKDEQIKQILAAREAFLKDVKAGVGTMLE